MSSNRLNCPIYKQCGSCADLHLDYPQLLLKKKEYLKSLLKKANLSEVKVTDVLGAKDPYYYRNKMMIGFTLKGEPGFYEENSHRVIPYKSCLLHPQDGDEIIQKITSMLKRYKISLYNEDKRKGFLRHVYLRKAFSTGDIMVVFVTTSAVFPGSKQFVKELTSAFKNIKTIVLNINTRKTSIVLGHEEKVLYGKGYIEDKLCGLTFKISPRSFYQINHDQCERLYNKAIELLDLKGNETVIDTYCGIGTIGMAMAKKAKQVIGVELNKEAIHDAIYNARANHIKNCQFIQGDATEFMIELANQQAKIDAVIMDPPRSGTTSAFIQAIDKLRPKKIVYISCDPSTQVRDLNGFKKIGYHFDTMHGVDLFPYTKHVETIVLLTRR